MSDYTETREGMSVNLTLHDDTQGKAQNWMVRLFALAKFLRFYHPGKEVSVYAYEDENVGGLRITEITFFANGCGSSYMRGHRECLTVIALCEEFCATHGLEPHRPNGWQSFINRHGECRIAILQEMGMEQHADAEYAKQLEYEATLGLLHRQRKQIYADEVVIEDV